MVKTAVQVVHIRTVITPFAGNVVEELTVIVAVAGIDHVVTIGKVSVRIVCLAEQGDILAEVIGGGAVASTPITSSGRCVRAVGIILTNQANKQSAVGTTFYIVACC